jgi:hypothetical protein
MVVPVEISNGSGMSPRKLRGDEGQPWLVGNCGPGAACEPAVQGESVSTAPVEPMPFVPPLHRPVVGLQIGHG